MLLVEDSEDDARVETPEAVTEALAKKRWDIVIADYTMPNFKGTDALEIVRNSGIELPFIFVSDKLFMSDPMAEGIPSKNYVFHRRWLMLGE